MNKTKQTILDTATKLLAQSGLSGAGLNEVIRQSEAPRGSLYYHFPQGKSQWVSEALEIHCEAFVAQIKHRLAAAPSLGQGISDILRGAGRMMQKTEFHSGCPIGAVILDLGPESEDLRHQCLAIMDRWKALIYDYFSHLPKAEAETLADLIFVSFEGALMLSRLEKSVAPLERMANFLEIYINEQTSGFTPTKTSL
jgi:TetR/AcrR family transcriptional regulator, lmrAB and yxaGH operons repressor